MTDKQQEGVVGLTNEEAINTTIDISFVCEEYGDLEQSFTPAFEFSSPISSISSTCSSPDRTAMPPDSHRHYELDEDFEDDFNDFVSLEELKSQISPPSDDECSSAAKTLTKHSQLETIYEDVYLETPPGTPTTSQGGDMLKARKRRVIVRTDLNKCDEFKENLQRNNL